MADPFCASLVEICAYNTGLKSSSLRIAGTGQQLSADDLVSQQRRRIVEINQIQVLSINSLL